MITRAEFLQAIEAYLTRTGMSPTAFGRKVMRDPNFVFDLRAGRAPSMKAIERVGAEIAGGANPKEAA